MPTKTKSAQSPGSAILRQRFHRSKGYKHADARNIHVLDDSENSNALVSVVERNDLEEMMYAAELADRDFTAERGLPQVIINRYGFCLFGFCSTIIYCILIVKKLYPVTIWPWQSLSRI